jgi:hypothetical protein
MNPLLTWRSALLVGAALLAASCDSGVGHVHANLDPKCEVTVDGVTHFVGDAQCFKSFPSQQFSGYWVTGHEYSAFYKNRQILPPEYDPDAVWLDLSPGANATAKAMEHGVEQIFEVEFEGRDPGRKGFFGHLGMSKRGVYVDRFLKLKEVHRP